MSLTDIVRPKIAGIIALFCLAQCLNAQTVPADSTRTDTTQYQRLDSLRAYTLPIPLVGSLDRSMSVSHIITDSAINFIDYTNSGDLLQMTPGIFIRDLGSAGQLDGITMRGIDGRGIAFMSDGILLNDPLTGIFNPNLYPTENIEHAEIITGTQAFLYALNSTGGAVNFVSKSKKALRPYSRIRYSESAYDYGFIDGLVSQDVIRGLNVTAGFQHQTLTGKFPNSNDDSWNARIKLRYNISGKFNVYFSENYNQTQVGLNGGVDTTTPYENRFDRFLAQLRNTDSYEKITRHDLQLGSAGKFLSDSTVISSITFFHSTNFREYRDEENRPGSNGITVKQDDRSQWFGVRLSQELSVGRQRLNLGGNLESRGVIASPATGEHLHTASNVFAKTDILPTENIKVSVYGRADHYLAQSPLSYGSDGTITPIPYLEFFGGYSRSFRFPTMQELYWRDSTVSATLADFPPERHHLLEAGMRLLSDQSVLFEITFFHRNIFDAIDIVPTQHKYPFPTLAFTPESNLTLQGWTSTTKIHVGSWYVEGELQYLETKTDQGYRSSFPKWSGAGGIYFWDKLFTGHLDLKVGIHGRIISSYRGMEYNPQALAFVPSTQPDVDAAGTSDLVLIAHIGSAYVHFIWENLPDRQYVIVPFYPMPDRRIRFGISWEFTN